ncbi:MAG: polyprenyl synthetase family protein [Caulobacteraceae bacterium]|nr:polyprenyl synthetase family protein [Caulobacteraceae bacterium]
MNDHADPVAGLKQTLAEAARQTDQTLAEILPAPTGLHARVQEAMRYAVFAGGKRLRPFLVLSSAALFGAPQARALRVAAAIEALHTYSLVHDDLPCMDDDDLRRGQPTTHRKFDEATAVLAGDALLTLSFEILAHPDTHPDAEVRCQLVALLAKAGGSEGMIGGQMMDIDAPNREHTPDEVILLQRMKTGALFEFSCEAGAILGGGTIEDRQRLRGYARDFGLAFQITDDLIDVTSSAEAAGKAVGKDQDQGKATLVSIHGVEGARRQAEELAAAAADAVAVYGPVAEPLRLLPYYLIGRET